MYSFYGGKQGAPFVIVKSFTSETEMINAFSQGYDYTEVGFDEYVLINTKDKTDAANGRLYRRGYNFDEVIEGKATGGAVYIGTIVGPAGSASKLAMGDYDTIINQIKNLGQQTEIDALSGDGELEIGDGLIEGSYIDENGERKYNDKISWASVCIRDNNLSDASAYIGFKVPYTIFDFITETIDSENESSTEQIKEGEHPFFQKWKIKIPRGFKGDSLQKLRVVTASSDDGVEKYDGQEEDRANGYQILVCDAVQRVKDENGIAVDEVKKIYVGDHNTIEEMKMSSEGIVSIKGTHSFEQKINENNPIKFLNNIKIEEGTQQVQVAYNISNDYYSIGQPLNAIQEMVINPNNYHLLVYYNSSIIRNQLNNSVKASYNGKDDWLDLGSIKDESGILIGFNIPRITSGEGKNDTIDDAIVYLNKIYPNGLGESDANLKGKVVTIGNGTEIKDFYAYDYVNYKPGTEELGTWYYIGTFDNNIEKILLSDTEEVALRDLSEGGVWLKITELGA